jgi:hypothetical protein
MPISADQWRGSVGSINASHSRVLGKSTRKRRSAMDFFTQLLSFLMTLFTPKGN